MPNNKKYNKLPNISDRIKYVEKYLLKTNQETLISISKNININSDQPESDLRSDIFDHYLLTGSDLFLYNHHVSDRTERQARSRKRRLTEVQRLQSSVCYEHNGVVAKRSGAAMLERNRRLYRARAISRRKNN
eukprot:TRINITY_DN1269_c5_g2_i3.p1 TRINITY_DN1269_c5_g2~~TRINITY_DN1269_c5_g2_i3.p1  ORF type:complete len:133 (-),score=18.42 TRINITY_DN1269_c5_g2_i3:401-799(-)